ncbi:cyclin-Q [Anopheles aquasalis]|uniref:cyclin-Q n=1 Tax=Anopheles aquasalis TaxID=42839 RepID=UPI00215AF208|nr:cyclin-Q [Anopheles aquasalis]
MMREAIINAAREAALVTRHKKVQIDYKNRSHKGLPIRFLFECAQKLNMKPLTSALAATMFHRFFKEVCTNEYDPYMIACTCLHMASKVKEDKVRKRDVINVAYSTINRGSEVLELSDEYWAMWDTIVQSELLVGRMLKFDMTIDHPHKYMLHYMRSLRDLFGAKEWAAMPVAPTAAAFLQDFHMSPKILDYPAAHVAVCCLVLACEVYGTVVPLTEHADSSDNWYKVFCPDLTRDVHWDIIEDIISVYGAEATIEEK